MIAPRGVKISGTEGKYQIATDSEGIVSCTCPHWKFQKTSIALRRCKHIDTLCQRIGFNVADDVNQLLPQTPMPWKSLIVSPKEDKPEWTEPF